MTRVLLAVLVLVLAASPASADDTLTLTVKHIARDGGSAAQFETFVINKATYERTPVTEGVTKVAAGDYALQTTIRGKGTEDYLAYPNLAVHKDVRVELDARRARPVVITPPDASAKLVFGEIVAGGGLGLRVDTLAGLAIAHLGARAPETSWLNTQWTARDGKDFYGLAWFQRDGLPDGFRQTPGYRDLAKVHAKFGASVPGKIGWRTATPSTGPANSDIRGSSLALTVPLPGERTEYYNTDTVWMPALYQLKEPNPAGIEHRLFAHPKRYQANRVYQEPVNHAVTGPAIPDAGFPTSGVERRPDAISVWVPMFSDGAGNAGRSTVDSAATVLYRDGVKIAENDVDGSGWFVVPAEDGAYRLETQASRTGVAELSTEVSVAWTFRSQADKPGLLPLSTIRFAPRLDAADTGRPVIVPVYLRDQRSDVDRVATRLAVEVSFDAGKTWAPVPVIGNAAAVLRYPPGQGTVSLRGKATDRHGNTVEQTIINAYRMGQDSD